MRESLINYVNFLLEKQSSSKTVNNNNQREKLRKARHLVPPQFS
jgi:hypothetical protein